MASSSSLTTSQDEGETTTSVIRTTLIDFIVQHTSDDNNRLSVINTLDEIILSYVVTVVQDSLDNPQCPLDVAEFSEMLSAYFPQFGDIPPHLVLKWVDGVHHLLSHEDGDENQVTKGEDSAFERVVTDLISQTAVGKSDVDDGGTLVMDDDVKGGGSGGGGSKTVGDPVGGSSAQLELLMEMFPCVRREELIGVLTLSGGDVEKAVQLLLLEEHESLPIPKNGCIGGGRRVQRTSTSSEEDDQKFLKERVVARYGFVDKMEDAKEFKPILPKEEPKKLVRYREGQVVSTKGERYTEVAVTSTGEEVKIRSYISKAQQLRMQQHHNH